MVYITDLQIGDDYRVNLKDVFDGKIKFESLNCIYCIHNLKDHKVYVGQSVNLYSRVTSPLFGHKRRYIDKIDTPLYNALNTDGLENFELIVLEEELDPNDLDNREMYWIKELSSCIYSNPCNGYNQSLGGSSPLRTPEIVEAISKASRANHGGVLAFHTEEAKAHQREAMQKFADEYFDGQLMGACHTPEAEALAAHNMRLSKLFNSINQRLKPGMTINDYCRTYSTDQKAYLFIDRIVEMKDLLRSDPRWTEDMERVFGESLDWVEN